MKKFIITIFALLCAPGVSVATPPNIVLFLVDDMGWMDCGVYGSK